VTDGNESVGRVRVRSNVVQDDDAWELVPGDALYVHRPDLLKDPHRPTALQRAEHLYYEPCAVCRRPSHRIALEGCTECPYGPSATALANARASHERAVQTVARIRAGETELSE
jgi:hypothetical protein